MPHRCLSLEEVAEHLRLSVEEVMELVKKRDIPRELRGGRIVFPHGEIDAWMSRRLLGMSAGGIRNYHRQSGKQREEEPNAALIPALVMPDFIVPDLASKTRAAVIRDLVAAADRTGRVVYPEDLRAGVEERERMCSTALPGGLAIPHPLRQDPYLFESSFVIVARAANPVPFGSPDGELTDLFFLMCCGDERLHVRLLARLCMMCHHTSLLLRLRETRDAQALLNHLLLSEQEAMAEAAGRVTPPAI